MPRGFDISAEDRARILDALGKGLKPAAVGRKFNVHPKHIERIARQSRTPSDVSRARYERALCRLADEDTAFQTLRDALDEIDVNGTDALMRVQGLCVQTLAAYVAAAHESRPDWRRVMRLHGLWRVAADWQELLAKGGV